MSYLALNTIATPQYPPSRKRISDWASSVNKRRYYTDEDGETHPILGSWSWPVQFDAFGTTVIGGTQPWVIPAGSIKASTTFRLVFGNQFFCVSNGGYSAQIKISSSPITTTSQGQAIGQISGNGVSGNTLFSSETISTIRTTALTPSNSTYAYHSVIRSNGTTGFSTSRTVIQTNQSTFQFDPSVDQYIAIAFIVTANGTGFTVTNLTLEQIR